MTKSYKTSTHATKAWARLNRWTGRAGWVTAPAWNVPDWMPRKADGTRAARLNGYGHLESLLIANQEILPVLDEVTSAKDGTRFRLNPAPCYHIKIGRFSLCEMAPYSHLTCDGRLERIIEVVESILPNPNVSIVKGECPVSQGNSVGKAKESHEPANVQSAAPSESRKAIPHDPEERERKLARVRAAEDCLRGM